MNWNPVLNKFIEIKNTYIKKWRRKIQITGRLS